MLKRHPVLVTLGVLASVGAAWVVYNLLSSGGASAGGDKPTSLSSGSPAALAIKTASAVKGSAATAYSSVKSAFAPKITTPTTVAPADNSDVLSGITGWSDGSYYKGGVGPA